ncbi:putative T7SS-secreted protein [Streptomyces sp. NPDC059740]|uniref:putative T7SS-secreted protein n=1 Tax=Streptomyces sp. NPDC059740 TaxID=3346926 RepID=UPI0036625DF1
MSTRTYDALGFDPAPGIPESVQRVATVLSRVGNQLDEARGTLSKVGRQNGIWEGDAASGFARKVGELPKYLADGHGSLIDAAHAMNGWHNKLTEFQSLAGRYESEAQEARRQLKEAEADPDLSLAGLTFGTEEALEAAQKRLDGATRRLDSARESLNHIIKKAQDLLDEHGRAAREIIEAIRRAAERAPDEPGLFDRFMDALEGLGDKIKELADDVWSWIKDHADDIYKIGDWLGMAAAACDVLAIVFSETGIGALVFEGLGRALNTGALAAHAVGWAAGAKKGSWTDIGLDLAGFVPFGDLIKGGKAAVGAFKGVEIAADSFKATERIGDIAAKARNAEVFLESKKLLGVFGEGKSVYRATADTFKDRFAMAADRVFNDATRYERPLTSPVKWLDQHVFPKIIDKTPLSKIPSLADAVKLGENGKTFIDPTSWVSRGAETAWRVHKFAGAAENALSDEVHGKYDQVKGMIHGAFG